MSEPSTIVIYGRDYEAASEIHCQGIADSSIAFGISVGTTSKPNEDCLGISSLEGDSFLFLFRGDELIQLNSLNAYWLGMLSRLSENSQTRQLVLKSLFGESKYMGVADGLETGIEKLQPGDMIFLCTDGLIGSDERVPEPVSRKIQTILNSIASLESKASELIQSALDRGEKDNVTCVVAQID
jgi:serine/threonine protein phosphatase PrpC